MVRNFVSIIQYLLKIYESRELVHYELEFSPLSFFESLERTFRNNVLKIPTPKYKTSKNTQQ